jgi:hypothetical protein
MSRSSSLCLGGAPTSVELLIFFSGTTAFLLPPLVVFGGATSDEFWELLALLPVAVLLLLRLAGPRCLFDGGLGSGLLAGSGSEWMTTSPSETGSGRDDRFFIGGILNFFVI